MLQYITILILIKYYLLNLHMILTEFNLKLKVNEDDNKIEMYNLKNLEGQQKFKECTSNTNMLSSIFESKDDIDILTKRFQKKLDGCLARSFKKIRMTQKEDAEDDLHDQMRHLKTKSDNESKAKLQEVLAKIADNAKITSIR